jgi:hypothetical protein
VALRVAQLTIVKLLNCTKTRKSSSDIKELTNKQLLLIFGILPEATGLFFVLSTFLSKSESTISLIIHPADRIKIAPIKNNDKNQKYFSKFSLKLYAVVRPHAHGQNNSINPIGFLF